MIRRSKLVAALQRQLARHGLPRFQMMVIVAGTGLAGFGASAAMLALGVSSMPVRYLVATLIAYVVFLVLVRLWAEWVRGRLQPDPDLVDLVPLPDGVSGGLPDAAPTPWSGGEGRFGGGGAGRSWDGDVDGPDDVICPPVEVVRVADGGGGSWFDLDVDDAWVLIVPLVLIAGGIVAAVSLVWAAPALLAEVLLDVLLVSGLYHRLRHLEPQSWLSTAVRRTWVPVAAVAVLLAVGGFVVQRVMPHADSIGDVFRRAAS